MCDDVCSTSFEVMMRVVDSFDLLIMPENTMNVIDAQSMVNKTVIVNSHSMLRLSVCLCWLISMVSLQ